jgi:protein SCO1/2
VKIDAMSTWSRGVAAAFAAVVLASIPVGCGDDEPSSAPDTTEESSGLSGYTRSPAPSVAEVQLPLVGGAGQLPAAAAPGGLRVVYFGYTTCPDVCPTTMSDLKRALAQLPEEDADRVEVVMVTIDPDRDVDEKLAAYVGTFIEDGQASRIVDPAALQATADAFGASYAVSTAEDGEVEVSHSADLYVVDDQGEIILQWPFGTRYEDIADDLSALLAETPSA